LDLSGSAIKTAPLRISNQNRTSYNTSLAEAAPVSNVSTHFCRRAGLFSRQWGPVSLCFRVREPTPYEPSHRACGRPSCPYGRCEPHVRPLCAYHPPTPTFGRRLLIWRSALHACCRELPPFGSARRDVRRGANRACEHPSRPRSRPPPCTDRPHRTFAADCSCAAVRWR
jgi:hypothetical protein